MTAVLQKYVESFYHQDKILNTTKLFVDPVWLAGLDSD